MPEQYEFAAFVLVVWVKSFRHVYPDWHVVTLPSRKRWICAVDMVPDVYIFWSLMRLPGSNPLSVSACSSASCVSA